MNAEFLAVLEFWEKEKGITKDVLLRAVQEALLAAAKKAVGPYRDLRVGIDPQSGDIKLLARLFVSEQVVFQHEQISLLDAHHVGHAKAKVGDEIEADVTPASFGRIAAQYAKQALMSLVAKQTLMAQVCKAEKAQKAQPAEDETQSMTYSKFKDSIVGNPGN